MDDTDAPHVPSPPDADVPGVPAPDPSPAEAPRRRRVLPWVAGVVAVLVATALVAAAFVRVPYVIISPGHATPLDDQVLRVEGATTYPHDGNLLFLTVAVSNRDPNLYRYLFARLDGDKTVQRRQEAIGCASYEASARFAREQMAQSQDVAKAVALRRLGYEVPTGPSRVVVVDVACDGPADGRLQVGDVIVEVDGTPVTTAEEVRAQVVAHAPGDEVAFVVERDGERHTVRVELGERPAPGPGQTDPDAGRGFAGIVSQTDRRHLIPLDIEIDTARVSGPSAGLAFSLAIIDDLTPGNLTGRGDVAVTGTIAADGSVGSVGGVAQKAATARRAGARLMLVPADEVAEARAHAGDMKVVGVRTLDDALRALAKAGGTEVPPAPNTIGA